MELIIGLDCSTMNIGWSIMDYETERLLHSGVVRLNAKEDFYVRLRRGPRELKNALVATGADMSNIMALVIEQPFISRDSAKANIDIVKKLMYMDGACVCILMPYTNYCREISPIEMKVAFAEDHKAKKQQVIERVKREFNISCGNDQADAIGIAASFIRLNKQKYFQQKADEKQERHEKKAEKRKIEKAVNAGKKIILEGELPL